MRDIKRFIYDNGILEYAHLVDIADQMEDRVWFRVVTSRSALFCRLLASLRNGVKRVGGSMSFPVLADYQLKEEEEEV